MIRDVARRLNDPSRFRLWIAEVDGRAVAAVVFLSAGGETSYWLGGFDDAAARFEPALLTILAAVKHAFEIGDHRMDLGPGDEPYKWRFADGHDVIGWDLLVARGSRRPSHGHRCCRGAAGCSWPSTCLRARRHSPSESCVPPQVNVLDAPYRQVAELRKALATP